MSGFWSGNLLLMLSCLIFLQPSPGGLLRTVSTLRRFSIVDGTVHVAACLPGKLIRVANRADVLTYFRVKWEFWQCPSCEVSSQSYVILQQSYNSLQAKLQVTGKIRSHKDFWGGAKVADFEHFLVVSSSGALPEATTR